MRLKTKLVVAITGLVFLVVAVLSGIFLAQSLHQHIEQSYVANDIAAHQLLFATRNAIESGLATNVNSNDPVALRAAVAKSLRDDDGLQTLLNSVVQYSPTVFDISIADWDGRCLLSTDPVNQDQMLPVRRDYTELRDRNLIHLLTVVFGRARVYNVSLALERKTRPFVTVRIGIRTTFLRNDFRPWFFTALTLVGIAMLSSLLISPFVANLALKPLAQISERLDTFQAEAAEAGDPHYGPSTDAVVQVSNKIERLGRRMRNVEEVFSALKENLDQIMSNLEDGILLFTPDAHAVLVSDSVDRFLGISRAQILGRSVAEIFDDTTVLGRTVRHAFEANVAMLQEEITTETGRNVQVSIDFIFDDRLPQHRQNLGALLTLHDLESVREIESELELSRRMAAIGRLTSGVGHEVKNPINAIVVHLELLKSKLEGANPRAMGHLEIIQSEIQRLDRVVQTLVDFSRPVDLQLQEQDLRNIVASVLALASAELATHNVQLASSVPDLPVPVNLDPDLMRQALLNVVLNGAQAMGEGGALEVRLVEDGRSALISVRDHGDGIPDDILQKIFDLYFTTKREGSGIGLAMTYRIIQLHSGRIDVESTLGVGTTFTLRIPLSNPSDSRFRSLAAAGTSFVKDARG
ncbi:MAG TPA: ATP-binding protein [Acidisarcina sp.]